jgi:regulator of cell morphogenesis and NO signaling
MKALDLQNELVGKIVASHPYLAKIFEKYQIDYCCRGNARLSAACQEQRVDLQSVLNEIEQGLAKPSANAEADWNVALLNELADHIVQTHHRFLREELPRLTGLILKVRNAHGDKHGELKEVEQVFTAMRNELESHMVKEEQVLFPAVCAIELSPQPMSFPFGSVANPIRMMEHEHDDVGSALRKLRDLTSGYTPPKDACPTFRVMLESLATLERDLHLHIHKENNILFPRAQRLEKQASSALTFQI